MIFLDIKDKYKSEKQFFLIIKEKKINQNKKLNEMLNKCVLRLFFYYYCTYLYIPNL